MDRRHLQRRSAIRRIGLGALLLVLAVGLIACGGREPEDEAAPEDTEAAAPGTAEADTVEVTLDEFEIRMPDTLRAGPTVFRVTNSGEEEHNFEVERGDMEEEFEENLQPGETNTLQVDLEAGAYRIYCPVENHGEQGMAMNLMVVEEATPAGLQ